MQRIESRPQRSLPRVPAPFRRLSSVLAGALFAAALTACSTVPISGRRQFIAMPVSQDTPLGLQAYEELLSAEQVVTSGADAQMVERVMQRLVQGASQYDPGFDWQVALLRNDQMVNAFCLPGGKMAVYTGILPIAEDETGLAVVMGHEIAHAIARHGSERVSTQITAQYGLDLLGSATGDYSEMFAELAVPILDLTVLRPWGRDHELEADYLGLIFMANAGYDPQASVAFWQRMDALSSGAPPEFLSTHPSSANRVKQLQEKMPQALEAYQAAIGS